MSQSDTGRMDEKSQGGGVNTPFPVAQKSGVQVVLDQEEWQSMQNLLETLREENANLLLEREIIQEMPIDFEDVLAVVQKEIRRRSRSPLLAPAEVRRLVRTIKRRHPNLFHEMGTLFGVRARSQNAPER